MCSSNRFSSSQWSRSHALSKFAVKYFLADVNTFGSLTFLCEVLGNKAILAGQYCAPQLWPHSCYKIC